MEAYLFGLVKKQENIVDFQVMNQSEEARLPALPRTNELMLIELGQQQ